MIVRVHGLVIRVLPYRESDALVTLLTREAGKIGLIAPGARKVRSRLAAHTQLLRLGTYILYRGRSLYRLDQADTTALLKTRLHDPLVNQRTMEMLEWVMRLTEDEVSDPFLYDHVERSFLRLDQGEPLDVTWLIFQLVMLSHMGYGPSWDRCTRCGLSDDLKAFVPQEGGMICGTCLKHHPPLHNVTLLPPRLVWVLQQIVRTPPHLLGSVRLKPENVELVLKPLAQFVFLHVPVRFRTQEVWRGADELIRLAEDLKRARRAPGTGEDEGDVS
ncbi:MAG: DNA recombination and repair protein RecO [Candidatus Carbobacillus altaicus]|uniref:DNA repair protein RecO n=1 Tax=Candidatus Carbonibacillus altaicus TaxID=2163959 RepID=A0A2R6Y317_9BACL|nr:MAG: DNA recombination and repair protein RecO [Candidatus Carbobacillus altaicus]